MSSGAAYIVKEILTEVVRSGAGGYAGISGISVGVKTGTTNDDYDRWFCGFTPYYTAATWVGYDENEYVSYNGNNPAGKIWDGVMEVIHQGMQSAKFSDTRPNSVTTATICKCSGKLATEACKNDPRGSQVYTEYFLKGTVPTETCDCHVKVKLCKTSGLIAGEYCPENEIEEKTFITRPETETGNWQKASDAKYMLTIKDTCSKHLKPIEPERKPESETHNNTVNNTTNTTENKVVNNTGNNITNNTTNNTTNNIVNNTTNRNIDNSITDTTNNT